MPELYLIEDFISWIDRPNFDTYRATVIRSLVTIEIRRAVGAATYDALTDLLEFKAIAMAAAKRAALNPEGLRSVTRSVDDYTQTDTYAAETLGDVELTEAEIVKIDKILGRNQSPGAFTVRPYGQPDVYCSRGVPWRG